MAHTLVDKSLAIREDDNNVDICVLDQDQEVHMAHAREKLLRSRLDADMQLPPQLRTKRRLVGER